MLTLSVSNVKQFVSVLLMQCKIETETGQKGSFSWHKEIRKCLLYEWKGLMFLLYLLQTILLLRVLLFKGLCQDKAVSIQEETKNLGSP